jgi:phage/plasmid-associated DNA primase
MDDDKFSSVDSILRETYTANVRHTHVNMSGGKYEFSNRIMHKFWEVYSRDIKNGIFHEIAEKPYNDIPVIGDIDIKMEIENDEVHNTELYTMEVVKSIVKIYQEVILEISDEINDNELDCVILTKDPYEVASGTNLVIKHGFHIHFPHVFLARSEQDVHLIPRVKKLVKDRGVFNYLSYSDAQYDKIIDSNCCKVHWLLYGSKKSGMNMRPYLFKTIIDKNGNEVDIDKAFKSYIVYDERYGQFPIKGHIALNLPRILSINPWGRAPKALKTNIPIPSNTKRVEERVREQKIFSKQTLDENLAEAKLLLAMLSDHRNDDYTEWMNIGWVLFNISDGCEEGLALWIDFSKRSPKFTNETECTYLWEKMGASEMTIGTLKYFAALDNPLKYKEYNSKKVEKIMGECMSGTHNDIAKIIHEDCGQIFKCSDIKARTWHRFNGTYWEEDRMGTTLRKMISNEVVKRFRVELKKIYGNSKIGDEGSVADDATDVDKKNSEKSKQINKIITQLKQAPFKDNVMKECCELFYDGRFEDKLNKNKYLMAFKNGVYDLQVALESKQSAFRKGRPEDYLSQCLPHNYVDYSMDDEKVQKIISIFEKIFPDKELYEYFFVINSEVFVGGNARKIGQFWTGEGNGGKTVTQQFFEKALASLSKVSNASLVTCKDKNMGGAMADIARLSDGTRIIFFTELEADELINNGVYKRLTGNDTLWGRDLFERGKDAKSFVPMFKTVFICNDVPCFRNGIDKATFNRTQCFPFESTFYSNKGDYPDTYEEQLLQKKFPMDFNLNNQIPELIEAFIWYLLDYYKRQVVVKIPHKVQIATKKYQQRNDIYSQFMNECVVEDQSKNLSLTELYQFFQNWVKSTFTVKYSCPNKNDVESYFSKIWGEPGRGKRWRGFKVCTIDEQVLEGKAFSVGGEPTDGAENTEDETGGDYSEDKRLSKPKSNKPPM